MSGFYHWHSECTCLNNTLFNVTVLTQRLTAFWFGRVEAESLAGFAVSSLWTALTCSEVNGLTFLRGATPARVRESNKSENKLPGPYWDLSPVKQRLHCVSRGPAVLHHFSPFSKPDAFTSPISPHQQARTASISHLITISFFICLQSGSLRPPVHGPLSRWWRGKKTINGSSS